MFMIEWLFDKMGYTKKIEWTNSNLVWEDIEKSLYKPAKKKSAKSTSLGQPAKKSVHKSVHKTVRKKA